jgi:putative CocE/NonD family hydrolase
VTRNLIISLLTLLAVAALATPALAAPVPEGANWTEEFITSSDGVQLHADILRPKNVPADAKVPVIVSIGPYFNHSGQTGPAGPVEGTTYNPVGPDSGPSDRFLDFIEGAKLMQRGYAFVMVDLRGFGGSNGCLDWGGPGEQSDVVSAVQWAGAQSWSNGNVGMYGKSYDAVTGLVGVDKRPSSLKAVVAQEPVYDLYRYLYGDGMRRNNAQATPALYNAIAATPGPLTDSPGYNANALNTPDCLAKNYAAQAGDDNHDSAFWKARDLIPAAKGSPVPLFLTQGLTENNTVADGLQQYMDNHTGYERAWLGPWEHVRGNETCPKPDPNDPTTDPADCPEGRLKMGRKGWFDEIMRFYDRFLLGTDATGQDPPVAVQTNDGRWRAEESWPPADAGSVPTKLRGGTYQDTGQSFSTGSDDSATSGVWTISPPLPYDAHLAGSGRAVIDVTTSTANQNLAIDVYDLDAKGVGPLITRQGHLLRKSGPVTLDLWSADWRLAAGHRIAVRVTDTNLDWWLGTTGSQQPVTVKGGTVALPFLTFRRSKTIDGDPGVQLERYLKDTVTVPAALLKSSESKSFGLPVALQDPPAGSAGGANAPEVTAAAARAAIAKSVRARLRAGRRGRLVVSGAAPTGAKLVVRLRRAGRTVRARRVTARRGGFGVRFTVKRSRRYSAIVTGTVNGRRVRVTVRSVRARLR